MLVNLNKFHKSFLYIVSWFIVAFGQPAWCLMLTPLSSFCGYGLFWIAILDVIDRRSRFLYAMIWFSAVQAIHLSWMTATAYHGVYILIVYMCVAIWFGVQFGLLSLIVPYRSSLSGLRCLMGAAIWVLLEWSRHFVFCGFPFNHIGIALSAFSISSQIASLTGVFGLSFIVMLTNAYGVKFYIDRKKTTLYVYAGLIIWVYGFGALHQGYHDYQMKQKQRNYQAVLIQTGLRPEEKIPLSGQESAFISPFQQWWNILLSLKQCHAKNIDLIILPEAAVPYGAKTDIYDLHLVKQILAYFWGDGYEQYLPIDNTADDHRGVVSNSFWSQAIANYYKAEFIIGLDDYDANSSKTYNAAFHFLPSNQKYQRYEKCVLVPLGEYLPFESLRSLVAKYGIADFASPGQGPKVYGQKVPIAISICYEECFGNFIKNGRGLGAELFVNITNDGWYLPSKLPAQHFYHGRLRSIENGVPLLRCCNTGVTAAIDSLGRTKGMLASCDSSSKLLKGALEISVPLYYYSTLYSIYGDWAVILLAFLIVGYACFEQIFSQGRSKQKLSLVKKK